VDRPAPKGQIQEPVKPPKEVISLSIPLPVKLHERLEKYAKDTGETIVNAAIFLIDYALGTLGY